MDQSPNQKPKRFGKGEILQPAELPPVSAISSCLNKLRVDWLKKGSLAALWQDWPQIAGKQLAKNCRPLSLRRGVLVVGASHPQWRQALQYNQSQLLAALKISGYEVRNLRIQQHHPSRTKQIESELSIWGKHPSRIDVHGIAKCQKCGSPAPAGEMALWGKCGLCRRKEL